MTYRTQHLLLGITTSVLITSAGWATPQKSLEAHGIHTDYETAVVMSQNPQLITKFKSRKRIESPKEYVVRKKPKLGFSFESSEIFVSQETTKNNPEGAEDKKNEGVFKKPVNHPNLPKKVDVPQPAVVVVPQPNPVTIEEKQDNVILQPQPDPVTKEQKKQDDIIPPLQPEVKVNVVQEQQDEIIPEPLLNPQPEVIVQQEAVVVTAVNTIEDEPKQKTLVTGKRRGKPVKKDVLGE